QDTAHHGHIQVDTGGNMRRRQAVAKQQVGQHQIVDMAAVARYVDDLVATGDVLDVVQIIDLDPVVQLVPEPGKNDFEKPDDGVGGVRGNFVGIARGALAGTLLSYILLGRFTGDGCAYQGA